MSVDEFKTMMEAEGWIPKDFTYKPKPEDSYRNFYYYAKRKNWTINHSWHIERPFLFWYKKTQDETSLRFHGGKVKNLNPEFQNIHEPPTKKKQRKRIT